MSSLSSAAALSLFLLSTGAAAQGKAPKRGGIEDRQGNVVGRLVMLHDLEATRQAQIARSRAQQGDCKGALDAFDAALKGSNDPTLRRDRGLCHEKLGDTYPAIDDYQAYLTALPDAPDSAGIRERLDRLQGSVTPAEATREANEPRSESGSGASAKASFNAKVGASGASGSSSASTSEESGGAGAAPNHEMSGHDAAVALEHKEAADAKYMEAKDSALRLGTGPIIGVVAGPRWFSPENANTRGGYLVAGSLRYSVGPLLSVLLDVGYTGVSASEGTASSFGGLSLLGGAEIRIPISAQCSDAILLGAGLGYERLKQSSLGVVSSIFVPRARAGYRHVFGASFGLEATLDAGYGFATVVDGNSTYNMLMFGPNVGLVSAF